VRCGAGGGQSGRRREGPRRLDRDGSSGTKKGQTNGEGLTASWDALSAGGAGVEKRGAKRRVSGGRRGFGRAVGAFGLAV